MTASAVRAVSLESVARSLCEKEVHFIFWLVERLHFDTLQLLLARQAVTCPVDKGDIEALGLVSSLCVLCEY